MVISFHYIKNMTSRARVHWIQHLGTTTIGTLTKTWCWNLHEQKITKVTTYEEAIAAQLQKKLSQDSLSDYCFSSSVRRNN
jgi:hypothetical protein